MNRPRLWIPEAPFLIVRPTMEMELLPPPVGLCGIFHYEILRGGIIREQGRFVNLITDAGMNGLGTTNTMNAYMTHFAVGSGTNAPAYSDTALQNQVGNRSSATGGNADETAYNSTFDASNPFWYYRKPRVFLEGHFGGSAVTLSEVGVFSAATAGTMFARQLIRDVSGNPTTIQIQPDEQLRLYYEIRAYPPIVVRNQVITIKSVSTTVAHRAYKANSSNSWNPLGGLAFGWDATNSDYLIETNTMPGVTSEFANTGSYTSRTIAAYVSGNFYRDSTAIWAPGVANFGTGLGGWSSRGERGLANTSSQQDFQQVATFTPKVAKDSSERVTLNYRTSWARVALPAGHL